MMAVTCPAVASAGAWASNGNTEISDANTPASTRLHALWLLRLVMAISPANPSYLPWIGLQQILLLSRSKFKVTGEGARLHFRGLPPD
jgi:hypothetical protein